MRPSAVTPSSLLFAPLLLLLPSVSWSFTPAKLIEPTSPYSSGSWEFGESVASAGDWNGDGYEDVIVGFGDDEGSDLGHAALYLGGPFATKVFYRLFHGENVGDRFGLSVAGAGDFNGDGYDDVVIGAPFYTGSQPNSGAFYLFYGGPGSGANGDATYDLKFAPTVSSGYPGVLIGFALAGLGDQNGDGYDDIAVGAPDAGPGGVGLGAVHILYGGPGAAWPGLSLHATIQNFDGYSVGAADVNHDGAKDVIVGSPFGYNQPGFPGKASIFLGGPLLDVVLDFTFDGEAADDRFGYSVSSAGDLNGDGWEDVVVGAPLQAAGGDGAGRAYVYWGGGFMTSPGLVLTGGGALGYQLGTTVSTAGNLDGDLDDELLVASVSGGQYVAHGYLGGGAMDAMPDFVVPGGLDLARVGDFNGDGLDDFVVGDPIYANHSGRATVYAGKSYKLRLPKPGQLVFMGSQVMVEWAGQDKADGYMSTDGGATWTLALADIGGDDLNRAAFSVPAVQTDHARVRLVATGQSPSVLNSDVSDEFRIVRPTTPPSPVTWTRWSSQGLASERRGWSVASAGDWNGDGYADVIAGAPLSDAAGSDAGRAYVYFGGPADDGVADRALDGQVAGDLFGYSVAGIGDANADGYDDVAVGAPFHAGFNGAVYVFFGGAGGDTAPDLVLQGTQSAEGFGAAVAAAGDPNGDGYADFAAGAPSYDGAAQGFTDAGLVRVYFGGPLLDTVSDLGILGSVAFEGFGTAIAGRGDVSGDGFDDLLVGAPLTNASTGRVAAIFGGPSLDNVADGGYAGTSVGEAFGSAVAMADVNGDGISDAVIGAPNFDANRGRIIVEIAPGPPDTGIAPGPPNTELSPGPPTLEGEAVGDMLGASVAGVGDVNGDGFADFAAGAPENGSGGVRAGRVYVVLGTPQLDLRADVVITGGNADDNAGRSVASTPPSRCCGFGSVIVGADQGSMAAAQPGSIRAHEFARYRLVSPRGGESWPVGALRDVRWLGSKLADLELSVDGGSTWTALAERTGGREVNQVSIRVPHAPTRFAMVRVNPGPPEFETDPGPPTGAAVSDSFFTIQTSVALLALLAAPAPDGHGTVISWQSDPGPEDLAGYRLESESGAGAWRTLVSLARETTVTDPAGGPGTHYRLFAVNGLHEELLLGETSLMPRRPLVAWPTPYRGGTLTVSFATASGMGGGPAASDVALFDVHGRRVRTIERGAFPAGYRTAIWDGRDEQGRDVGAGIYFLRARSGGQDETMKLSVLR